MSRAVTLYLLCILLNLLLYFSFFFFNDTATTEIYTLSLHDALPIYFARGGLRRIKAETFLDCISQVTETKNKFPGLPVGARAVQIADGTVSNYFLSTFGRATRETVCSCEVKLEPTLSQSLHLLNGDATTQKIAAGNVVGRWVGGEKPPMEIIEELYVRSLCRK